ncbi:Microtubule bundling protein [Savitreella phatthalungensis]
MTSAPDATSWKVFQATLEAHYAQLEALHLELGGPNHNSQTSGSLIEVLKSALEASLDSTRQECARVRQDCEAMVQDMSFMRVAMGDNPRHARSATGATHDPFAAADAVSGSPMAGRMRIKAPLLDSQKVLKIEHAVVKKAFGERAQKVRMLYKDLAKYLELLPASVIDVEMPSAEALAEEAPPLSDVSLAQVGRLDNAIRKCREEVIRRRQQVQSLAGSIVGLWAELAVDSTTLDNDLDRRILLDGKTKPETLGLRDEDIELLQDKKNALELLREERKLVIDRHLEAIRSMHAKLKLPLMELENFMLIISGKGVSDHVLRQCEAEEGRLRELKRQHIGEFISAAREELADLWDRLLYGDEQRERFAPAFSDECTEEALQEHENEVKRLDRLSQSLAPLIQQIARHMELVEEKKQFAIMSSDPARFSQRGYNPMQESKMRTRIEKTMPRVEQSLKDFMSEYEVEHGEPFLVWGERYPREGGSGEEEAATAPVQAKVSTTRKTAGTQTKSTAPASTSLSSSSIASTTSTRPKTPVDGLSRPITTPGHSRSASTPAARNPVSTMTTAGSSPSKRVLSDSGRSHRGGGVVLQERQGGRLNAMTSIPGSAAAKSAAAGTTTTTIRSHSRIGSVSSIARPRSAMSTSRSSSPTEGRQRTMLSTRPAVGGRGEMTRPRSGSQSVTGTGVAPGSAIRRPGLKAPSTVTRRAGESASGPASGAVPCTPSARAGQVVPGSLKFVGGTGQRSLARPMTSAGMVRPSTLASRLKPAGNSVSASGPASGGVTGFSNNNGKGVQSRPKTVEAGRGLEVPTMHTENWDAYRSGSAEEEDLRKRTIDPALVNAALGLKPQLGGQLGGLSEGALGRLNELVGRSEVATGSGSGSGGGGDVNGGEVSFASSWGDEGF